MAFPSVYAVPIKTYISRMSNGMNARSTSGFHALISSRSFYFVRIMLEEFGRLSRIPVRLLQTLAESLLGFFCVIRYI
jgi:hypothetical protein